MRLVVLLLCLSAGCLAQRPQQCQSPPVLSGSLSVTTQNEKLMAFARYSYDALRQRIRLREFGSINNQTFHLDVLLLYKLGVMYQFDYRNRTCYKRPLDASFHPLEVPKNSSLLGQIVLGSSADLSQGVLVNNWAGDVPMQSGTGKYISTVTESGCVPVSNMFHTDQTGWMMTSFFNTVSGMVDPEEFIPPAFCATAKVQAEEWEDPVTFYSVF